jgi:hypothetical protein
VLSCTPRRYQGGRSAFQHRGEQPGREPVRQYCGYLHDLARSVGELVESLLPPMVSVSTCDASGRAEPSVIVVPLGFPERLGSSEQRRRRAYSEASREMFEACSQGTVSL